MALQADIKKILSSAKNIAVVGLSPKSIRPSHQVASYLIKAGFSVIPVNPGQRQILGMICYPNLTAIPIHIDIVDIFRNPAYVLPVVEEAISIRAGVVWMQKDIVHEEAAQKARKAGLSVIMDRCLKVDHMNFIRN